MIWKGFICLLKRHKLDIELDDRLMCSRCGIVVDAPLYRSLIAEAERQRLL